MIELATDSLFGGIKIVWATSLPAKSHPFVLEVVAKPLARAYLVLETQNLKKNHKLIQTFEEAGNLAAIACYGEDRSSLTATIKHQMAKSGYNVTNEAAALVAARCDFSVPLIRSEVEKLMTFAGADRHITLDDVDACLTDQQTAALSDIVDNALDGEVAKSLVFLERFTAVEQSVVPVLVILSSWLLRLHTLRTAVDSGIPAKQAIRALKPPVFFKQQEKLAAQLRRWQADALVSLLAQLNNTIKETRLKPALAENLTADFLLHIAKTARATQARGS